MPRKYAIHILAGAILLVAVAALPAHMRTAGSQWLYEQAMAFCGPNGVIPIFGVSD